MIISFLSLKIDFFLSNFNITEISLSFSLNQVIDWLFEMFLEYIIVTSEEIVDESYGQSLALSYFLLLYLQQSWGFLTGTIFV